jgi:hypothetical protein
MQLLVILSNVLHITGGTTTLLNIMLRIAKDCNSGGAVLETYCFSQ